MYSATENKRNLRETKKEIVPYLTIALKDMDKKKFLK